MFKCMNTNRIQIKFWLKMLLKVVKHHIQSKMQ